MALSFKDFTYKNICKKISFTFEDGEITGFLSDISIKDVLSNNKYNIFNNNNLKFYLFDFAYCEIKKTTFYEEAKLYSKKYKMLLNNIIDNYINNLNQFGFESDIIYKNISKLSYTEKKILSFLLNISLDFDVIIITNYNNSFDRTFKKNYKNLLKVLKENHKTIVLENKNVDYLYEYTDKIVVLKKNFFAYEDTKTFFTNCKLLIDNDIEIPTLPKITYLALNDKKVKLFYHDDVRDIMKDIYKHV